VHAAAHHSVGRAEVVGGKSVGRRRRRGGLIDTAAGNTLQQRIHLAGLRWGKRDGSFTALPHAHHGVAPDGQQSVETHSTRAIYLAKGAQGPVGFGGEGLSTLKFHVEKSLHWAKNGVPQTQVFHHHVVLD